MKVQIRFYLFLVLFQIGCYYSDDSTFNTLYISNDGVDCYIRIIDPFKTGNDNVGWEGSIMSKSKVNVQLAQGVYELHINPDSGDKDFHWFESRIYPLLIDTSTMEMALAQDSIYTNHNSTECLWDALNEFNEFKKAVINIREDIEVDKYADAIRVLEPLARMKAYNRVLNCSDEALLYFLYTQDMDLDLLAPNDLIRLQKIKRLNPVLADQLRKSAPIQDWFLNFNGLTNIHLEEIDVERNTPYALLIDYEITRFELKQLKSYCSNVRPHECELFIMPLDFLTSQNLEDSTYHELLKQEIGESHILLPTARHINMLPLLPKGSLLLLKGAKIQRIVNIRLFEPEVEE